MAAEPLPSRLAFQCGWCNRGSNMDLIAVAPQARERKNGWGWVQAGLYQCPTCNGASLALVVTEHKDGSGSLYRFDAWPLASARDMEGLPDDVTRDRDEAWRALHGSLYKGAALLARSALQVAVIHLNAEGGSLRAQIHSLATSGVITKRLAEWADEVRITGNEAAHEMQEVDEEDAKAALYFLDSFLDAVYAIPHRQEERRKARERREAEDK